MSSPQMWNWCSRQHGLATGFWIKNHTRRRPFWNGSRERAFSTHSAINKKSTTSGKDGYVWSKRSSYRVTSSPTTKHSFSNNSRNTFSVPLTVSDVHLRHEQLPFAYFFRETLDPNHLKSSLRRVLKHFPVVGGRINRETFQTIDCGPNDSIPLSFGVIDNMSLEEWLSDESTTSHSYVAGRGHPMLLPLFDPLFDNNSDNDNDIPYDNLLKIRVTYFECGGTALGVNFLHALGDTASCVRFVQCWGREMQRLSYPRGACNVRANVNVSGMMTLELAELMGLYNSHQQQHQQQQLQTKPAFSWLDGIGFYEWFAMEGEGKEDSQTHQKPQRVTTESNHEYIQLCFPADVLVAMKEVGMASFNKNNNHNHNHGKEEQRPFVSTNDLVTAFGWLLKRSLSGEHNWNISMVVNMRGRCGVDSFTGMPTTMHDDSALSCDRGTTNTGVEGLFGNGITNVVAVHPVTTKSFDVGDVTQAARSIRLALEEGILQLPDRLLRSRMGMPSHKPHVCSTAESFPTTSWSQFRLKDISFSTNASLAAFHGHLSHPLPRGQSTYSSVITKTPRRRCGNNTGQVRKSGIKYNLLLPSNKVREAKQKHKELCRAFLAAQLGLSNSRCHRASSKSR